jgi:hypothetical protein
MSQETQEKTFSITGTARLSLSNIRGSVEIRPGIENLVEVTAIKHTESGDAQSTEIELSQAVDESVKVATHFPDGWWLWLLGSRPCRVDYLVKVPQGSLLKLKGVENSVLVDGLAGEFDLASVSGDLTLRDLTGPVHINTVSGDISAKKLSGAFELVTVSGDLEATDAQQASISAKTVSGHLAVQTTLANGPYRFDSVSGDVRLQLPAEARFSAHLSTISGDISSSFPATNFSRSHGSQAVDIQGGGVAIDAKSVSGNLQLHPFGDAPRAASIDRREILERLERGEIQPEEALAQMQG